MNDFLFTLRKLRDYVSHQWSFYDQLLSRRRVKPDGTPCVVDWKLKYLISLRNSWTTPTESWVGKLYLDFKARTDDQIWLVGEWASESLWASTRNPRERQLCDMTSVGAVTAKITGHMWLSLITMSATSRLYSPAAVVGCTWDEKHPDWEGKYQLQIVSGRLVTCTQSDLCWVSQCTS